MRPLFLPFAVTAGLVLASCAGVQRQPAPQGSAVPAESLAAVPTVSASAPAQGPTASELNRKLLSQASSGEEGDLPLGPGDLIEVLVFEVPELSNLKLRTSNSGNVTLPLIGTIQAAGLTAVQLQTEIRDRLQQKYMHDPQVSLFVHEHKSQRISVIGAVRNGGVHTLSSRLRLADALAMAGGLTDEAGPMVYVIRRVPAHLVSAAPAGGETPQRAASRNGETAATEQVMTAIDLQSLVSGKEELNLPLQAGDVVEVARAGSYYVGGEVNRPGAFLLKSRTTLDQGPVAAGGVKDAADWDDIRLYRARPDGTREVLTFSLNEFEKGQPAPEIQANDVIIVGKSGVKAFLYGLRDFFRFGWGATIPIQ